MTTDEAQSTYDSAGTLEALAKVLGCSKSKAFGWCRDHGVKLRRRGGWQEHHYRKRPRAIRLMCESMKKLCVTHDLGEQHCAECKRQSDLSAYGGIVSTLEVEGFRR